MTAVAPRAARGRRPLALVAALLGAALAAWAVSAARMRGMDAGPGTDPGGLAWFLGIWVTMMAAMMLPATAPVVVAFAAAARRRAPLSTPAFVGGYLVAWAAFGVAAYGAFRLLEAAAPDALAWDRRGPWAAGAALALAGLYQLTPLKDACLRHCRSPFHVVVARWRPGARGALRMGAEHGVYCVGCCAGLMLALFALGVMSLVWMAVVAGVVLVEKTAPFGARLTRPLALTLVAAGILVAAAPGAVPGLGDPSSGMAEPGAGMP